MSELVHIPYSPTTEENVLACLIIEPEIITKLDLTESDFYIERNRFVFQAILDVRRSGKIADAMTIAARLDERGQLSEIGGAARIMDYFRDADIVRISNAESYAKVLREKAIRRNVIDIARSMARTAMDEDDLDGGIAKAMDRLSRITVTHEGATHFSNFANAVYDEVEKNYENPKEVWGIETGLYDFDMITGGLQRGETLKLTGEPGIGKSALGVQLVVGAAQKGTPGAIYALEMRGTNIARRTIAASSKVPTRTMRTGKLNDLQWPAFTHGVDEVSSLPIYLSDFSGWTTTAMRADLQRLISNYGIQWVMVDYEGLLTDDPDREENARLKVISSRLHGVIKDLNLGGLIIDDMNKEGIKGGGGNAGLSGPARKIYDADSIVFMMKHNSIKDWVTLSWGKTREDENNKFLDLKRTKGYPAFELTTKHEDTAPTKPAPKPTKAAQLDYWNG